LTAKELGRLYQRAAAVQGVLHKISVVGGISGKSGGGRIRLAVAAGSGRWAVRGMVAKVLGGYQGRIEWFWAQPASRSGRV